MANLKQTQSSRKEVTVVENGDIIITTTNTFIQTISPASNEEAAEILAVVEEQAALENEINNRQEAITSLYEKNHELTRKFFTLVEDEDAINCSC